MGPNWRPNQNGQPLRGRHKGNGWVGGKTYVTHKQSLLPAVHLGHELVQRHDGGDAAEDEDEDAEADEAGQRDTRALRVVELVPGHDDADVDEADKVQQHVDAAVDLVVPLDRLLEVLAVPVEPDARHEARQQVVGANGAARADDEKLRRVSVNDRGGRAGRPGLQANEQGERGGDRAMGGRARRGIMAEERDARQGRRGTAGSSPSRSSGA